VSDEPKPSESSPELESGVDGTPALPGVTSASTLPTEPSGEDTGAKPDGGEPPRPAGRRGRTVAIVLAVVLGVVSLLCVGGLGTGYLFYRQVSEPDRSTPGVVLRQYLDVTLNERDDGRARLFTCHDAAGLAPVQQLRDDMRSKETQYGITIRTSPEGFDTRQSGTSADVDVKLRLSVSANGTFQEQIQGWRFSLKKESGWRVCAGKQTS
jgi:hypothetical protein